MLDRVSKTRTHTKMHKATEQLEDVTGTLLLLCPLTSEIVKINKEKEKNYEIY